MKGGVKVEGCAEGYVEGLQRLPYSSQGFSDCELIVSISKLSILPTGPAKLNPVKFNLTKYNSRLLLQLILIPLSVP